MSFIIPGGDIHSEKKRKLVHWLIYWIFMGKCHLFTDCANIPIMRSLAIHFYLIAFGRMTCRSYSNRVFPQGTGGLESPELPRLNAVGLLVWFERKLGDISLPVAFVCFGQSFSSGSLSGHYGIKFCIMYDICIDLNFGATMLCYRFCRAQGRHVPKPCTVMNLRSLGMFFVCKPSIRYKCKSEHVTSCSHQG